jgi:hypothetical protein
MLFLLLEFSKEQESQKYINHSMSYSMDFCLTLLSFIFLMKTMKKITSSLFLAAILPLLFACKSGKASCDAYGKFDVKTTQDQASK